MSDAHLVFTLLGLTLAAFVWGRLRYDLVALLALIAAVLVGVVEPTEAFLGFGHPAVITVAAVLVLSRGFQRSGLVDWMTGRLLKVGDAITWQLLALVGTVAVMSAFMNNVGALALLLPVAMRIAREHRTPPSRLLMPLAFGSLLGGLSTLIGTPPNIIVSNFRADRVGESFGLFSFLPVGGGVALAGVAFLVFLGWRLTPLRKGQASQDELFETADYLSELQVVAEAKGAGWTLRELQDACEDAVPVVAVIRGSRRIPGHAFHGILRPEDVLLVEAEPEELRTLQEKSGFQLAGGGKVAEQLASAADLKIVEAVVRSDAPIVNRTVAQLRLHERHGLHLLAVARDGGRLRQRLNQVRFHAGDVLLLQGDDDGLAESLSALGCLPLASRDLGLGKPRRLLLSVALFAAAVVAMLLGWLPSAIALTFAAVAFVLTGILPLREVYDGIDWPIIVLLGALIPVGEALEATGGARMIAQGLMSASGAWPPFVALILLFTITQALSDVINNAAAAVLMAPIAMRLADGFSASPDPFLMAVAVAASCSFLTPIGHQSNTLVMGPGGYRFGDYWRVGLPLTFVVMGVAIPLILVVWPM
ncbi:MAG: anion permease [Verrucomicrobiae bacterium]|nr:anion permease [Verrucomicrobiae bacterium]